MKLKTDRLILREFKADDLAVWNEIHGHPLYAESDAPQRRAHRDSAELLDHFLRTQIEDPRLCWELAIQFDQVLVGSVGLRNRRSGVGGLGWGLHPDYWGMGLAAEAVSAVMRFAQEDLKLHRLEAWIYSSNTRSRRLAERVGLKHEATLRSRVRWGDGWEDDCIYARVV